MQTKKEASMTRTQTLTAVSALVLLMGASIWTFSSSRSSHVIVIPPVQEAQR